MSQSINIDLPYPNGIFQSTNEMEAWIKNINHYFKGRNKKEFAVISIRKAYELINKLVT